MSRSEEVLTFWFGSLAPGEPPGPDRMRLWFRGGDDVDRGGARRRQKKRRTSARPRLPLDPFESPLVP